MHPLRSAAPDRQAPDRHRHVAFLLAFAQGLLQTLGAFLVAYVIWGLADRLWFQHRAAEALADGRPGSAGAAPPRGGPAEGEPLARLCIRRLGLDVVVAEGTSDAVLARAVGHLTSTPPPDGLGNVALAAHRDTFFRDLGQLTTGDEILLFTAKATRRFRVDWTAVVGMSEMSVIAATDQAVLTLLTCYPFRYLGSAPQRFVVRAHDVDRPAEVTRAPAGALTSQPLDAGADDLSR